MLDRGPAQRIGREDVRYLRSLQGAAAAAVGRGASADAAWLMARRVAIPRAERPDFEAFDWPSANARRALAEAGHEAFSAAQGPLRPSRQA